jgi:hypothetical protein
MIVQLNWIYDDHYHLDTLKKNKKKKLMNSKIHEKIKY